MGNKELNKEEVLEVERIFMSLEKEYILQLLQVPSFYEYLKEYLAYSNQDLMRMFSNMQQRMENGEVKEEDEADVELSMIACVLAMADKIKELILIRTPHYEEEEHSHERGRR